MSDTSRGVQPSRQCQCSTDSVTQASVAWVVGRLSVATATDLRPNDELLDILLRNLVQLRCAPGEVVCQPSRQPVGLFVIQKGVLELAGKAGTGWRVAQVLRRGDTFGAEQIICGQPVPWLVRAAGHLACLLLPRHHFQEMLTADPQVGSYLRVAFARRLVSSSTRLAAVLERRLQARTARILLLEERGGVVYLPPPSLAALAGISPARMDHALRELSTQRVVEIVGSRITLLDRAQLSRLAGVGGPSSRAREDDDRAGERRICDDRSR